ncbi:hypothetical protein M144_1814 [Bacteroides fragilis str. 3-F-2 |nr:hypothetical protein M144_1814 [Bacteroides fragilis str. 3-F-2 \
MCLKILTKFYRDGRRKMERKESFVNIFKPLKIKHLFFFFFFLY